MSRSLIAAFSAAVDVALIRSSPGGDKLSDEMVLLLALIAFDDYLPFPSRAERAVRAAFFESEP